MLIGTTNAVALYIKARHACLYRFAAVGGQVESQLALGAADGADGFVFTGYPISDLHASVGIGPSFIEVSHHPLPELVGGFLLVDGRHIDGIGPSTTVDVVEFLLDCIEIRLRHILQRRGQSIIIATPPSLVDAVLQAIGIGAPRVAHQQRLGDVEVCSAQVVAQVGHARLPGVGGHHLLALVVVEPAQDGLDLRFVIAVPGLGVVELELGPTGGVAR